MGDKLVRASDIFPALQSAGVPYNYATRRVIEQLPAVDAVARCVYDQVAWERDMAIMQLKDIGKSLGEKMDDVAKVVRCRECIYYNTDDCDDGFGWCNYSILDTRVPDDWYCAGAAQREDGDT